AVAGREELEIPPRPTAADVVERPLGVVQVPRVPQTRAVDPAEIGDARTDPHSFGRGDAAAEPDGVELPVLEERAAFDAVLREPADLASGRGAGREREADVPPRPHLRDRHPRLHAA